MWTMRGGDHESGTPGILTQARDQDRREERVSVQRPGPEMVCWWAMLTRTWLKVEQNFKVIGQ